MAAKKKEIAAVPRASLGVPDAADAAGAENLCAAENEEDGIYYRDAQGNCGKVGGEIEARSARSVGRGEESGKFGTPR